MPATKYFTLSNTRLEKELYRAPKTNRFAPPVLLKHKVGARSKETERRIFAGLNGRLNEASSKNTTNGKGPLRQSEAGL
jgi:hypothetical protein